MSYISTPHFSSMEQMLMLMLMLSCFRLAILWRETRGHQSLSASIEIMTNIFWSKSPSRICVGCTVEFGREVFCAIPCWQRKASTARPDWCYDVLAGTRSHWRRPSDVVPLSWRRAEISRVAAQCNTDWSQSSDLLGRTARVALP